MENFNPINKIHQIKKIIIIQPFAFILYIYIVCSISTVSVQFIRSFVSDFVNKKQQLQPNMKQQTGSKLGKEYIRAVCYHPAYLTYTQSKVR